MAADRDTQVVNHDASPYSSGILSSCEIISDEIVSDDTISYDLRMDLRNFGFILKDVARLYSRRFEDRAVGLSLTIGQCKALGILARNEGISQKRLSELAEIEPMTLVRILDRMESDAWIERRPDPVDRRARTLYVTPRAAPILDQITQLSAQMRAGALA